MSNRVNKYIEVKQLPASAMNVEEYAASRKISKQAIYNQIRRGKVEGYKIVVFKGFNFVLPDSTNAD